MKNISTIHDCKYISFILYFLTTENTVFFLFTLDFSRLGGVVVSVLGSKPAQGDGFLRAIKIRSTPSSRMGSKAGRSRVVRFYGM
jgi:hypothetical protein